MEHTQNQEPLNSEINLKNKIEELGKQCLYLKSDLENIRRTMIKEIEIQGQRKEVKILSIVTDFIDNLDRFFQSQEHNPNVEIMQKTVSKMIQDLQLTEIKSDNLFDPSLHEALTFIPTTDETLDEKIQMVSRKGYMYKQSILRPSQVIVYKKN